MNYKSMVVILITIFCIACIGVSAQIRTTNNLLFLPTPKPISELPTPSAGPATPSAPWTPPPPVIMNFDNLPNQDWTVNDCNGRGSGAVSHGILTINSPSDCYEYLLFAPKGLWNSVNYTRGWVIEANLRVDPVTVPTCSDQRGSSQIWASDHVQTIIFGFSTNEICIAYPEMVSYAMDTTNSFHVYRFETKQTHVRIYVDGQLVIDHFLTTRGLGTQVLDFGDGTTYGTSRTQWDYLSYDVFPVNLAP